MFGAIDPPPDLESATRDTGEAIDSPDLEPDTRYPSDTPMDPPDLEPEKPDTRYPGDTPLDVTEIEKWAIHYTNEERKAANRKELGHDPAISDIARAHSADMADNGLSHVLHGKHGTDRALEAGYNCRAYRPDGSYSYGLGENIAEYPRVKKHHGSGWPIEFFSDSRELARGLIESWMDSPGHRANLLDSGHQRIGVGIAIDEEQKGNWMHEIIYATQNFSQCP